MGLKPFTVGEVSNYISKLLNTEPLLNSILVVGEISKLTFHRNGSIYFSISDGTNKLDCVMFDSYVTEKALEMKEGQEVILSGGIRAYHARSQYSLWVKSVEPVGQGDLAAQFEEMKQRLNKEGLFDKKHKKELPELPRRIGIVTSATGAAVEDMTKILRAKTSLPEVIIFPVLVQGQGAAEDISNMLENIGDNFAKEIDVLIVGRGGGSPEDLAVFNQEEVARAIFKCPIPIISAVGHEIDTTIADLVADARAETPTAAANMVIPGDDDLIALMEGYVDDLKYYLSNGLMQGEFKIQNYVNDLHKYLEKKINDYENEINSELILLKENNPKAVLEKGYTLVTDENGKPIVEASALEINSKYNIVFKDGRAVAEVLDKEVK